MTKFVVESSTFDILNDNFDSGTLERGRGYYKGGRVRELDSFSDNLSIHVRGTVRGSGRNMYTTNVSIDKKENSKGNYSINGGCSCYVNYNCKHVVATVLEVFRQVPDLLNNKNSENKATLVNLDINRWFTQLQSVVKGKQEVEDPMKDLYSLFYILKSSYENPANLVVELVLAKKLKRGGYGKVKQFDQSKETHRRYLQSIDHEIIAALQSANLDDYGWIWNERSRALDVPKNSDWMEKVLHTERCYWQHKSDNQITLGDSKELFFQWELLPNASQSLKPLVSDGSVQIFVLDQLWYIDVHTEQCGLIVTDMSETIVQHLLEIPDIPPSMTTEAVKQIKSLIPKQKQLLPRLLNEPIIRNIVKIIPEIYLKLASVSRDEMGYGQYGMEDSVELPLAEVVFDYDGKKVPASPSNMNQMVTYIEKDVVYSFLRDFEKEGSFFQALNEHMDFTALDGNLSADKPERLWLDSIDDNADFLDFSMSVIPQLEKKGWRVFREHEVFSKMVFEDDVSWYSELDESSGYDYFSYKMGIVVEGESINILPIIAGLIRNASVDQFKDLPDNEKVLLPLPDGKMLSISYSRIKPILNILIELYDTKLSGGDEIKLLKSQAVLLVEIEKAFSAVKMRWLGGEKLRKLGKQLTEFKAIKKVVPPKTFQATLRNYQQDGVSWLQFLREYSLGGILADDMGLGKTVQVLAHLSIEKNKRRMKKPTLIIAPTSLMANWRLEAERFTPNLSVLVYHGDERGLYSEEIKEHDIVLTTYPLLLRDKEVLLRHQFYYLILDEAQFIKNHKAKSVQVVQQLNAEHRLCMTGTPMENHLGELWSLFHFLMPGFLGDAKQFKHLFRTPIEKNNDLERRKNLALRVKPFLLRRLKSAVLKELPEKTNIIRSVILQAPERDLYESIRLSMEKKVRDAIEHKGLARSHIIILDALLKLRQTCCHPKLLKLESAKKAYQYSAKMEWIKEMLPKMVAEGRKILIFSQFTTMLGIIEETLKEQGMDYVKLTGSTKNRSKPIEAFQSGAVPIFLISLKAGGTGLNLTKADTVIHYDPWWNPAVEDQATDRAHRIGQKQSVFVYKLIASGTIEETIQMMQQKKRQLMDGLFSEESHVKLKLSADDLQSLFEPLV